MTAPADPAAPDPPPPSGSLELGGLDAHQLLKIGLDTVVMPQGLDPDPDATVPVSQPSPAAPGHRQPDLPLPEQLTELLPHGNYLVVGFLGHGGMGAVYQGTQVRLKRPVAIKIMRRDQGRDYDFEARFEREAQAMAKLNHPNIVSVIDFGEAGSDYLYIVMELVEGADLMDVIRTGRMTQEMALSLLPQICDALQFAHDHGIVHRDIKPSNIMLTRDGRIKIADFGLAKHFDAESSFRTQTGTGMGTPDYAAPEQFNANVQIDHRADIYALGVMIYQMITGELPRGVWKAPSQRAQVDTQWDDIVSHAMQSDPADRYQQASEIKTDVSSITLNGREGSEGIPARPASSGGAASKKQEAHRSARAPLDTRKSSAPLLFGIIGLAAVIALGAFFGLRPDSSRVSRSGGNVAGMTPTDHALASAATIASPEPAAIKLWDSAEKLPKQKGVAWEDNAMRLDGAGLFLPNTLAHDSLVRASVRMNPDAKDPILTLRRSPTRKNTEYQACIKASAGKIVMERVVDDVGQRLSEWPLPRAYAPTEWLKLEFRAVGDALTITADGVIIGTVKDATLSDAGTATIHAEANGYFRDIEVINLDGLPEAEALRLLGVDEKGNDARGKTGIAEGWQNLIPLIQPATHTIRGNWEVKSGELICKASPWALCEIPVDYQGGSYDMRVTVTRGEGEQLALFFPFRKGDAAGDVVFDYFDNFSDGLKRAGLESLSRQKEEDPGNVFRMKSEWIPKGKRSTVLLQVRDEGIAVSLNGEEVFRWKADWTQLHQFRGFERALADGLNGRPVFGVGLFNCDAVYHSIEMREITGEEARLLPPAAGAK